MFLWHKRYVTAYHVVVVLRPEMKKTIKLLKEFSADQSGATAIEYGLIAALVGVAIIGGLSTLVKNQDSAWNGLVDKVDNP